jgi:hypothetical protein
MQLDLKEFALTIAVGLAFWGSVLVSLRINCPQLYLKIRTLGDQWDARGFPLVLGIVVLLASGIVIEDLSKNAVSRATPPSYAPTLLAVQFSAFIGTEVVDRDKFLETSTDGTRCESSGGESALTDQAQRLIFALLHSPAMRSNERALFATEPLRTIQESTRSGSERPEAKAYCGDLLKIANPLYYIAKNAAFRDERYFRDIDKYRVRYDFERSMAFALLAGCVVLACMFSLTTAHDLLLSVGDGKTAMALIVFFALTVGTLGTLGIFPTPSATANRSTVGHGPDVLVDELRRGNGDPHSYTSSAREAVRIKLTNVLSAWSLGFVFVWTLLYRLRRVPVRLITSAIAGDTTAPRPAIVRSHRELRAAHSLAWAIALSATIAAVSLAYTTDFNNYLGRVYGYYEQIVVDRCHDQSCKPDA